MCNKIVFSSIFKGTFSKCWQQKWTHRFSAVTHYVCRKLRQVSDCGPRVSEASRCVTRDHATFGIFFGANGEIPADGAKRRSLAMSSATPQDKNRVRDYGLIQKQAGGQKALSPSISRFVHKGCLHNPTDISEFVVSDSRCRTTRRT
jgi:hypothetical protein